MSPQQTNLNSNKSKDFSQSESAAYKPAYKDKSESDQNQEGNLPLDLVEVVEAWPQLSDAMKKAILAIIEAAKDSEWEAGPLTSKKRVIQFE